jgi:hypothetical protein
VAESVQAVSAVGVQRPAAVQLEMHDCNRAAEILAVALGLEQNGRQGRLIRGYAAELPENEGRPPPCCDQISTTTRNLILE